LTSSDTPGSVGPMMDVVVGAVLAAGGLIGLVVHVFSCPHCRGVEKADA